MNYYEYLFEFETASKGFREYQGTGNFKLRGDASDLFKIGESYIVGIFSSNVQPICLDSYDQQLLFRQFGEDMKAVSDKWKAETVERNERDQKDLARAKGIPS